MYTAVILTEPSRSLLLSQFGSKITDLGPDFVGTNLLHHVTVNLGDFDQSLNFRDLLGVTVTMNVVSFAYDEKVAAFGVEHVVNSKGATFGSPLIQTFNKIPHITAAINPKNGGKPFLSNKLQNWNSLPVPVSIKGILSVTN